jgi:GNAT superfamily N-acetyltransferase
VTPGLALAFRTAGPTDVPAIVALVQSAYRGEASRAGWTTEADLLDGQRTDGDEVGALISKAGSEILLAEADGTLVASCHLERRSADTAYFGMFAVQPGQQGGGIGRRVLHEAARLAATWGCRELRMTVIRQRSDLIAWYVRRGFSPTGETLPFPYGDERFGRPRRDDLEFAVLAGPIPARAGQAGQAGQADSEAE